MKKFLKNMTGAFVMPAMALTLLLTAGSGAAYAQCTACVNAVTLPTGPVPFSESFLNEDPNSDPASSTTGFIRVTLSGNTAGTSLASQTTYTGWCAAWHTSYVENFGEDGFLVYSSYSPLFPAGSKPLPSGNTLNMVNYILNNKQGTVKDVQNAIWLIMTGEGDAPSATALAMAGAAQANPAYFPPSVNGVMAVFYAVGPTNLPPNSNGARNRPQSLFFEIKLPSIGGDTICAACVSSVVLPPAIKYSGAAKNSYASSQAASTGKSKATLVTSGVAAGYSVTNRTYNAWFGGWWTSTLPSSTYSGFPIYSTYASTYPAAYKPRVSGNTMNMVNYILNNKQGTVQDVQNAISLIMVGSSETTPSAAALAMAAAAKLNPAYCPPTGGIIAVVIATSSTPIAANPTEACNQSQTLIVETKCGEGPFTGTPGLSLKKTASKTRVNPFEKVTYTYVVTNTGSTPLTNIAVVDDNATPGYVTDDFTVGTVASLAPGASATLTASIYPPVQENAATDDDDWRRGDNDDDDDDHSYGGYRWGSRDWDDDSDKYTGGSLILKELPNGNIQFTYRQDSGLTDTSYGRGTSGGWGYSSRSLQNFANYEGVQFQILDKRGNVCLDFVADYLSQSSQFKSGYGTLGVKGGGGGMYKGDSRHVLSVDTSLSKNLNRQTKYNKSTKDSPGNSDWEDDQTYTIIIDKAACAKYGFGGVKVPKVKNYQSKRRNCNNHVAHPTSSTATNTATASVIVDGNTLKATAKASVTVDASSRNWSQCSKY